MFYYYLVVDMAQLRQARSGWLIQPLQADML